MSAPLVVDASVAVQIILEEPASEVVRAYLADANRWHPLLAPSIIVSETVAAITKKVRRKEIDRTSARAAFLTWRELIDGGLFVLIPANDLLEAAFELSLSLHHPLHDCVYLALAKERGAAIATRDAVLAPKARQVDLKAELIGA